MGRLVRPDLERFSSRVGPLKSGPISRPDIPMPVFLIGTFRFGNNQFFRLFSIINDKLINII
jgi:hypothetical protein